MGAVAQNWLILQKFNLNQKCRVSKSKIIMWHWFFGLEGDEGCKVAANIIHGFDCTYIKVKMCYTTKEAKFVRNRMSRERVFYQLLWEVFSRKISQWCLIKHNRERVSINKSFSLGGTPSVKRSLMATCQKECLLLPFTAENKKRHFLLLWSHHKREDKSIYYKTGYDVIYCGFNLFICRGKILYLKAAVDKESVR